MRRIPTAFFIKPNVRRVCWLFCWFKPFWFHILDEEILDIERFIESRNISKNRTLPPFPNILQLETQGADLQSKVDELLNQSMRDRDKLKDDVVAHLSDQTLSR